MRISALFIIAVSVAVEVASAFSHHQTHRPLSIATTEAKIGSVSTRWSQVESASRTFTVLKVKDDAVVEEESSGLFSDIQINPPYFIAYLAFTAFGFAMTQAEAPGASQAILEKFLADPVNPGVNELFATIFNLLGLASLPFAYLTMPGAKGQKPPLVPFLLGGVFAGYGSIGLAVSTRKEVTSVKEEDLGWVTKNILENKIFNWAMVALASSVFVSTGLASGLLEDAGAQIQGYTELVQSSAIASVSSCDLAILTIAAASLIPEDLKRRGVEDSGKATAIAASTVLLPIFGAVLYGALRPKLEFEE